MCLTRAMVQEGAGDPTPYAILLTPEGFKLGRGCQVFSPNPDPASGWRKDWTRYDVPLHGRGRSAWIESTALTPDGIDAMVRQLLRHPDAFEHVPFRETLSGGRLRRLMRIVEGAL